MDGRQLASGSSCSIRCNAGYTLSGVQPACATALFNVGSIQCSESHCAPYAFGSGVVASSSEGCIAGQMLGTHNANNCSVECGVGYRPSSEGTSFTVTCAVFKFIKLPCSCLLCFPRFATK